MGKDGRETETEMYAMTDTRKTLRKQIGRNDPWANMAKEQRQRRML